MKYVLLMRKSTFQAIRMRGILHKGGVLPPGSIRVWGGVKHRKFGPGDWRPLVVEKTKDPASLKDNIHAILHGSQDDKIKLARRHFYIADTPQFMKELGLKGDFFSVRYGVISRHAGKDDDHNLTEQNWIDLCGEITQPFAITKHGDGFNIFLNIKVNDNWVLAGTIVQIAGKNIEINVVRTAFGVKSFKNDEIIYRAEKITPEQAAVLSGTNSANIR
jgi:hypothetical protein